VPRTRADDQPDDHRPDDPDRLAQDAFGVTGLRPWQREAVEALVSGRDVVLIEGTGSGKSLVFWLAGRLRGGWTLVVSPLLALQADQRVHLEAAGMSAARLSSEESDASRRRILEQAAAGELDHLFLAPEQLARDDVAALLADHPPALVAIDEAHCVSEWGHDFRPDYLRVGRAVCGLDGVPVLALTATAAPPVRAQIVELLCLDDEAGDGGGPLELVGDLTRDNLRLSVRHESDEDQQRARVRELVLAHPAGTSGLVYCRTRRSAEEHAAALSAAGRSAEHFHAGLGRRRKAELQDGFLDGSVEVLVATSAFGMGIDKPDVRFVVHAEAPASLDSYVQESGRAGRDGEPAEATLVFRSEDLALGRFFAGGAPKRRSVDRVLGALQRLGVDPDEVGCADPDAVAEAAEVGRATTLRVLDLLDGADAPTYAAVRERAKARSRVERSRVEQVDEYAATRRCRAEFLLSYFGQPAEPCGHCDICGAGEPATPAAVDTPDDAPEPQTAVDHPTFGSGVVTEVLEDRVTVLFDDVGYRTLDWDTVREHGLLEPLAEAG